MKNNVPFIKLSGHSDILVCANVLKVLGRPLNQNIKNDQI